MQGPKFEKSVQEKLEELKFSPSPSVWMNIEQGIAIPQKRWRPMFWWVLIPVVSLLGAGAFFYFKTPAAVVTPAPATSAPTAVSIAGTKPTETSTLSPTGQSTAEKSAANTLPVAGSSAITESSAVAKSTTVAKSSAVANSPAVAKSTTVAKSPAVANAVAGMKSSSSANNSIGMGSFAGLRPGIKKRETRPSEIRNRNKTGMKEEGFLAEKEDKSARNEGSAGSEIVNGNKVSTASEIVNGNEGSGASKTPTGYTAPATPNNIHPLSPMKLAGLGLLPPDIKAKTLSSEKKSTAIDKLPTPKRPWEAGFVLSAGISSPNQSLFHSSTGPSPRSGFQDLQSNRPALLNSPGLISNNNKQLTSDMREDFSFLAGIQARKPLSSRWAITLGMNLHYYSTRLHIGEKINNYTPAAASLISLASAAPIQSYPYYSAGNDQSFTNKYYFMELPVTVQWQLNRSRIFPIFWEGGAALSYLMSSDALYYDTQTSVYFKDGSTINRTQLSLSSALMVGIPLGGVRIQAGPQVQYGVSPLLNTQVSVNQHLLYGGFRLVITPVKK